jgi:hypothetical protein
MRCVLLAVVGAAVTVGTASAAITHDPSPEPLSAWSELINNQIVTGASALQSNSGTRVLAAVHLAQYQAVDQLLREYGLTWKTVNPYKIRVNNIAEPLVEATAAAARTVLLGSGATAGIYPTVSATAVNALYAAQTVNADPSAIAIGVQQGLAVLASRVNDGTSPDVTNYFGESNMLIKPPINPNGSPF